MYFRKKAPGGHTYLQIVESRRKGDQVRQQVIATLGRVDELQASGQLERLLRPGARLAAKAMVLSGASDDATKIAVRRIGPVLVFERLWEETVAELEARQQLLYILGVRERGDKLVREFVLNNPTPFVPLVMTK